MVIATGRKNGVQTPKIGLNARRVFSYRASTGVAQLVLLVSGGVFL